MAKEELVSKVRLVCHRRKFKLNTEKAYIGAACRFFEFSRGCRELPLGEGGGRYLDQMAPHVSAKTQHGAVCALAFPCNEVLEKPVDFGQWKQAKVSRQLLAKGKDVADATTLEIPAPCL